MIKPLLRFVPLLLLIVLTLLPPVSARPQATMVEECSGEICEICHCECRNAYQACIASGTPGVTCMNQFKPCYRDCFCNYCPGGLEMEPGTCE